MTTSEIEGLTFYDDGSIGLGGTTVPPGAEFPAVQLGDWTLSKALGQGCPLVASRGDGRRLVFEFRGGAWSGTETDTVQAAPRKRQRTDNPAALTEQLKHLAAIPLSAFHAWPVTEAEPSDAKSAANNRDIYVDGDVTLFNDGTVVLGSESFQPGSGIEGYQFGSSVAYREPGGSVLVVASPGSVRWYNGRCRRVTELPYDSPELLKHTLEWWFWTESRGLVGWLKEIFQDRDEGQPEGMVKTWHSSRERLYGCRGSSLVYVGSCRAVYVRILGEEIDHLTLNQPQLRYVFITEPKKRPSGAAQWDDTSNKPVKHEEEHEIEENFAVIPQGTSVSYHGRNLSIEARPNQVTVIYSPEHVDQYFENAKNTPDAFCRFAPPGYIITHGEHSFRYASWSGIYYGTDMLPLGGWDWFKLTPRQGAVSLPQLDGRPLKRLGV